MSNEERTEEQMAQDLRLNEQCFLLANLDVFEPWGQGTRYPNILKLNGHNPTKFIGSLVKRPGLEDLAKLKPSDIAELVPYIKIYKVFYESENSEGVEYELKFENYLKEEAVQQIMTSRRGRGAGAGIKSFEWKLAGGNPVEADRMIEAKMTLFFQSMDILTAMNNLPATNPESPARDVSYIDLIHQANKFNSAPCTGEREYNNKYFRIKATVGWASPSGGSQNSVLEKASATFFLTMVKHDIAFDDMGGVTLTIDYMAAPEGILSDPRADVLNVDRELTSNVQNARAEVDSHNRTTEQACGEGRQRDEDAREADTEALAELEDRLRDANAERYKAFLTAIDEQDAIYYVDVPVEQVDEFQTSFFGLIQGDLSSREDQIRARLDRMRNATSDRSWASQNRAESGQLGGLQSAIDDANTSDTEDRAEVGEAVAAENVSEAPSWLGAGLNSIGNFITGGNACTDPSKKRINYIFMGTVLEVAFQAIKSDQLAREIRNIVGPFDYKDPITGDRKNICIADVPVSLNMFKVWFYEQCVEPQREVWTIKDFIKNLVSSLVEPAMGSDCFGACANGFRTRPNMRVMELPLTDDKKCRITGSTTVEGSHGNSTKLMREVASRIAPWPSGDNAEGLHSGSYFFVYASSSTTNSPPPGDGQTREERDAANGVYHFVIGSDRGILKKISFKRADSPHIEAARIQADGPGRLAIRSMYNADIDLIGNSAFIPGQMVFVDPGSFSTQGDSGTAGSAANILGIGGYYLVTSVDNAIESGKFETRLSCQWQSYGEGRTQPMDKYCQPATSSCPEDENCEDRESDAPTTGGPAAIPDGVLGSLPGVS